MNWLDNEENGYEHGMNAFEHFPLDYDLFL